MGLSICLDPSSIPAAPWWPECFTHRRKLVVHSTAFLPHSLGFTLGLEYTYMVMSLPLQPQLYRALR